MESVKLPLVVIYGPTASGKTPLAIGIAKKFNGEIICADSRSIYKGANVGTAKPTLSEQSGIVHFGLDLVEPGQYFSAADFKKYANQKILEIRSRGRLPILVGGTGLYVDCVVFDYQFGTKVDENLRTKLQQLDIDELYKYCESHEIALPENYKNKRYVMREIERNGVPSERLAQPIENTVIVGITTDKQILRSRIEHRADQIIDDGVIDEAKTLGDKYGWDSEAMTSNIYPLIRKYLDNEITIDDLKDKFITLDWRLAKRQLTWLRRNRFIHWFTLNDAKTFLNHELANRN